MAASATKAGYESSMFVVKPSEKLECPICFNILNDPHQCSNGHLFCHMCISDALKKHQVCPLCKIDISAQTLGKNLYVQGAIEELDTYCISHEKLAVDTNNTEDKCSWVGPLHNRAIHYETICQFYPVQCSNTGCGIVVLRKNIAHHVEEDCQFTLKPCPYCPISTDNCSATHFQRAALEQHKRTCQYVPVKCADCAEKVPQCDMSEHLKSNCKLRKVFCPLFAINACSSQCPKHAPRVVIEAHVLTLETVERVVEQILSLRSENQILTAIVKDTVFDMIGKQDARNNEILAKLSQLSLEQKEKLKSSDDVKEENVFLRAKVNQLERSHEERFASLNQQLDYRRKSIQLRKLPRTHHQSMMLQ